MKAEVSWNMEFRGMMVLLEPRNHSEKSWPMARKASETVGALQGNEPAK